jgi:tetratricopeptide (TPR) repeat protein
MALEGLARYDQAIAATEESQTIYERAGDRFGVASTLEVQGNIASDRGDPTAALTKYQQELTIVRDIGNKRGEASALSNMAMVMYQQGDLEHSRVMWEEAAAAFRELGDKSNTSVVLVNIGAPLKDQGELAAAKRNYEQALALARETGDKGAIALAMNALGTVLDAQGDFKSAEDMLRQASALDTDAGHPPSTANLLNLGDVLRHRGDMAGAGAAYREALTASKANGEKSNSAYAYFGLGRLELLAADFGEASRNYDEALRLRKELGETFTIAQTETALAELAIEQGRPGAAESTLRSVQEVFAKADRRDDATLATTLLIRSLLLQGKTADAAHALDGAGPPGKIQSIEPRLSVLIAQGRVQPALAKESAARNTLQVALDQAQRAGYREYFFEARLAILEAGPASIRHKTELQALSHLADQSGFKLIAAKSRKGI